jgi:FtsP/CotA-like multicopper oxidase with cupredoxin domain
MGLTAFSTFIDDSLACHLHNNKFSIHSVTPGRHKFQVRADGKKPKKNIKTLDIELKPGQKYYIMVDVTDHYLAGTISLVEITENTSRKMLPKLEEDKNCL